MQTNFELEMNWSLESGVDGFYHLYYQGDEVFGAHDDQINADCLALGVCPNNYMNRLYIVVGRYESNLIDI